MNTMTGSLISYVGSTLIGWACREKNASSPCLVEVLVNETVVEIVVANYNLGAGFTLLTDSQRRSGFMISLSSKLTETDCIEARFANTNQKLQGHFYSSQSSTDHDFLLGQVENRGGLKVWGWLYNPILPQQVQKVTFSYKGVDLACIEAGIYREDLAALGINLGNHGFEWTLPICFADGRIHEIEVFDALGNSLAGSSLQVFVPQKGYQSWVNQLDLPSSEKALLSKLAEGYQHYVGHSVDFSLYGEWFAQFGAPVAVPVCATKIYVIIFGEEDLDATLNSLYAQTHQTWEALICGRWSDLVYQSDARVRSIPKENWTEVLGDIFQQDDLVTKMLAGDVLAPQALATAIFAMNDAAVNIVYSDCDVPDEQYGRLPWFKPDWDIDLFLNTAAMEAMCVLRGRHLTRMIKDDYETPFLWVANALVGLGNTPTGIKHLPWVFYHCFVSYDVKNTLASSALWLTHYAKQAEIASTEFNTVHIAWPLPKQLPRVSILIPTRDRVALLSRCIDTLRQTDYPDIEWIVIDNDSREEATHAYFAQLKDEGVNVIPYAGSFNFSAMNNHAVAFATGEVVALVNNDVELLHPQWLTVMISELMRPDVGIVGAKLLWENNMVQHAGVLLGLHSLAGHIGNDWHNDDLGYFGLNQHVRGVSAVTAACLLCRREDYLKLNGLNATELMVNFNDVDFCLRMQETLHKRVIWTPHARLRHLESASRGREQRPAEQARTAREMRYMRVSWASKIASDLHYNPNLNFDRYSHAGLSFPPRN